MPVLNDSELLGIDAAAAVEAVEAEATGSLRTLVEFDADRFAVLYVDDETRALYEDDEHMLAHFDRIHSYVHLDLTEMDLLTEELFPVADRVEYIATALDPFTLVRVYVGDRGLFLALDPGERVEPVVGALRGVIDAGGA